MPRDERAWKLNAAKLDDMCLLCYHRIPDGWGLATEGHHIQPKGMGGTKNEFVLEDARNDAPTCLPHHQKYQSNRVIWVKHMMLPPLNFNYEDTQLAHYIEAE